MFAAKSNHNPAAWRDESTRLARFSNGILSTVVVALISTVASCSGGGEPKTSPPPPVPDFTLTISPVSASAVVGNTTSKVTVSVEPQNGFTGSVQVTLQGLPSGASAIPRPSFSQGSAGSNSHTAQFVLTIEPIVTVKTYQSGSLLYLESDSGTDVARVGLNMLWGGSIVEVSLNGTNFVNEDGTGREVQAAQWDGAALYDNCAGCTGIFGWNPVQAGDKWNNGSPVLAQTMTSDSIYVKAQPLQWDPDDKGGGPNSPVLGDTYVEQTLSAVVSHSFSFRVH